MKRKKDGGKREQTSRKIPVLDCPSCGCPNRPNDKLCMFCNTALTSRGITLKMAAEYYIDYARSLFASGNGAAYAYLFLTLAIALLMTCGGVWFVISAISHGGMINWALGTLLIFYGVAAIRNVGNAIRKS